MLIPLIHYAHLLTKGAEQEEEGQDAGNAEIQAKEAETGSASAVSEQTSEGANEREAGQDAGDAEARTTESKKGSISDGSEPVQKAAHSAGHTPTESQTRPLRMSASMDSAQIPDSVVGEFTQMGTGPPELMPTEMLHAETAPPQVSESIPTEFAQIDIGVPRMPVTTKFEDGPSDSRESTEMLLNESNDAYGMPLFFPAEGNGAAGSNDAHGVPFLDSKSKDDVPEPESPLSPGQVSCVKLV